MYVQRNKNKYIQSVCLYIVFTKITAINCRHNNHIDSFNNFGIKNWIYLFLFLNGCQSINLICKLDANCGQIVITCITMCQTQQCDLCL